jgi:3-oxoacyl-[acyl-carrier protein] reductase
MTHNLTSKVALVTGASRGLGAAIAARLAECGAKVAINYCNSPDRARRLAEEIRARGGSAEVFEADVRDEQQVSAMVAGVVGNLGPVDILVLNATGPQPGFPPLEQLTWHHCLSQLEYFVKSPVLLASAVVGSMKQRRFGRIIHIGSEAFELGLPLSSHYVAAKGAQLGLTRSWASELAASNITVNLVAPGYIPTERHQHDSEEDRRQYAAEVPMQHLGEPWDVAEVVAFLASEGGRFITGQKLAVNGGNTLA